MKTLITFALMAFFSMGASAQSDSKQQVQGPAITFEKVVHDYGTIIKGGNGECVFAFTNTGNEPLILSSVRASCGCTTPSWTNEPVMPGQKGQITVGYNTNTVGPINKSVTVNSNAANTPNLVLRITGKVSEQ